MRAATRLSVGQPVVPPDASGTGPAAGIRLRSALDARVAAGSPGAILAVDAPRLGVTFADASGRFERGGPRPLRPGDAFRAASVTKAVTAAAAVRLAAAERWRLDDPVAPFLSSRIVHRLRRLEGLESVDTLTIRRLLGHTSGLPDYFFDERFQARVRAEPGRMWRPEELVEAAAEVGRLTFAPGTDFSYGDTGYVLAGLAIEHLTDRPLADAYRALVLDPLEMDATCLEWHEPLRAGNLSHHYDGERDLRPLNTSYDWGGGGLVTTAADLIRFLRGLFGGALFDRRWLRELTAWQQQVRFRPDGSARYVRYGLGIGLNHADGAEIVGATGVWGAFAYYWEEGDAAIAGTLNVVGGDRPALLDEVVRTLKAAASSSRA